MESTHCSAERSRRSLRDQGLQWLEDNEIIEKARTEGRVILTHDLDFGRIIAVGRASVSSVITSDGPMNVHDRRLIEDYINWQW